ASSMQPCTPACVGNQACVLSADGSQSVCRSSLSSQTLTDLPNGTGLTPSLAFLDDKAVIAYYDSINKVLKAVQAAGTGRAPNFGLVVVLDGMARISPVLAKRDVGRFPSLAIGKPGQQGGRIAIAYPDLSRQQFLLYQSDALTQNAPFDTTIHVLD